MLKHFNLLMLGVFSGWRRTECFEVGMGWADAEAMGALAHAVRDYFHVE